MRTTYTELTFLLAGAPPLAHEVLSRLHAIADPSALQINDEVVWEIRRPDSRLDWTLKPVRVEPLDPLLVDAEDEGEEEAEALLHARWALVLTGALNQDAVLEDFANLIRIGLAAAPNTLAMVDTAANAVRSRTWLLDAVQSGVPLAVDALYQMHAEGSGDDIWMRTHGLRRCGLEEIEILGVREDRVQAAGALLETVANRAILYGLPDFGEEVVYGKDVHCALVPWRYVHADIEPLLGGSQDREFEADEQNLVICTWEPTSATSGRWESISTLLDSYEHPMLFLTDYETERSESLARLRWQSFASLVETYGKSSGWRFLAKFGYGGDGETAREHLWFQVHRADAFTAEATLLNKPLQQLGIEAGARMRHSIDHLTDFRIGSPVGTATPESIGKLLVSLVESMDADVH